MPEHAAGHIDRDTSADYEQALADSAAGDLAVQARPFDTPANHDRDVREFAELMLKRRRMKETIDGDKKRMDQLEQRILDTFSERGLRAVDLAGVGKVSIRKQLWAKVRREGDTATEAEKQKAIQALKDAGLDEYVSEGYNLNTISALFREYVDSGQGIPPALEEAWEADRRYTLSVYAARS